MSNLEYSQHSPEKNESHQTDKITKAEQTSASPSIPKEMVIFVPPNPPLTLKDLVNHDEYTPLTNND